MPLKFRYEGCRWPFPHRISGDGYDRLMNGLPGAPQILPAFVGAGERLAAVELRVRLRAEGRLLEPAKKRGLPPMLERVLRVVQRNPLQTVREIASLGAFQHPGSVGRRLNEMKWLGYVEQAGRRRCPLSNCMATMWRLKPDAVIPGGFDAVHV